MSIDELDPTKEGGMTAFEQAKTIIEIRKTTVKNRAKKSNVKKGPTKEEEAETAEYDDWLGTMGRVLDSVKNGTIAIKLGSPYMGLSYLIHESEKRGRWYGSRSSVLILSGAIRSHLPETETTPDRSMAPQYP